MIGPDPVTLAREALRRHESGRLHLLGDPEELADTFARALLDSHRQLQQLREAADWYRRCLEGIIDGLVVRGLAEASAAYDTALVASDPDTTGASQ